MKKRRIRISIVAVLLLFALLTITACGSSTGSSGSGGSGNTNEGQAPEPRTGMPGGSDGYTPPAPIPEGESTAAGEPKYGGIVTMVTLAEGARPIGIPWECRGGDTYMQIPGIETLIREYEDGYRPLLAEWFEMREKEIEFKLREDVNFIDGTHFDAEAAKWNIEMSLEYKLLTGIDSVEVRDEYTLVLHSEQFLNSILQRIATRSYGGMVSPTAFNENGLEWARENQVGTGPFKVKSFTRYEVLEYERNDNYWQPGIPYLDGIRMLFINDDSTLQMAMLSEGPQSIDVLNTNSGELISTLTQTPGIHAQGMNAGPISMYPSSKVEGSPLSKLEVRQAISYAIDREALVAARGFGLLTAAYQFIPAEWGAAHLPDSYNLSYDLAKAKELMVQAGYPDGFTTTAYVSATSVDRDIVVAIQGMLAEIGIRLELEFPDSGRANDIYTNLGWDGLYISHLRIYANPATSFQVYFTNEATAMVSVVRPHNLLDAVYQSLYTPQPSMERCAEVNKILLEDMTVIPIYNVAETFVIKDFVKGGEFATCGSTTYWIPHEIWIDK